MNKIISAILCILLIMPNIAFAATYTSNNVKSMVETNPAEGNAPSELNDADRETRRVLQHQFRIDNISDNRTLSDNNSTILANGTITITFPQSSTVAGATSGGDNVSKTYCVINNGTGTVTVAAYSGETINGVANDNLTFQYESYCYITNGQGIWRKSVNKELSGLTAQRVPFAATSTTLADNDNLTFDNTTGKLKTRRLQVLDNITTGTINNVTITQPATAATLTITDNKTLNLNQSVGTMDNVTFNRLGVTDNITANTIAANSSMTANSLTLSTALPLTSGGTGATTKAAAFDNLSPTTTQGDLIYHDGTNNVRLAKVSAGQILRTSDNGTIPQWGYANFALPQNLKLSKNATVNILDIFANSSGTYPNANNIISVLIPDNNSVTTRTRGASYLNGSSMITLPDNASGHWGHADNTTSTAYVYACTDGTGIVWALGGVSGLTEMTTTTTKTASNYLFIEDNSTYTRTAGHNCIAVGKFQYGYLTTNNPDHTITAGSFRLIYGRDSADKFVAELRNYPTADTDISLTTAGAWTAVSTTQARKTFVAPYTGLYKITAGFDYFALGASNALTQATGAFGMSVDGGSTIKGLKGFYGILRADAGGTQAFHSPQHLEDTVFLTGGTSYNLDIYYYFDSLTAAGFSGIAIGQTNNRNGIHLRVEEVREGQI